MLRRNAASDTHLHRFAEQPGEKTMLVNSVQWCRCGEQHPRIAQAFLCVLPGCGFLLTMPIQEGPHG